MVKDVRETLASMRGLVSSPELAASIVSLHKTLDDIGKLARTTNRKVGPLADSATTLMRNVDGEVDPLMANLNQTLDQARAALKQAEAALASVDDVVAEDSPLMWELQRTLKELRNMSRSINALAEDLQRQPDSIIRGKSRLGGN
jgi:paraquat-inducible protein B